MLLVSSHIPFFTLQPLTPFSPLSFPFPDNVVLPLSPNLSSSAGPLLHLVGSLLLQEPATAREWMGSTGSLALDTAPDCGSVPAALNSAVHSLFDKMWSTIQNCCWYYLTSVPRATVLNTYGFYRKFLSCLYQTKANAHQQLDINTQRASPA